MRTSINCVIFCNPIPLYRFAKKSLRIRFSGSTNALISGCIVETPSSSNTVPIIIMTARPAVSNFCFFPNIYPSFFSVSIHIPYLFKLSFVLPVIRYPIFHQQHHTCCKDLVLFFLDFSLSL